MLRSYDHIDVDDGFGSKAGHRSAAHVLDGDDGDFCQSCSKFSSDTHKVLSPSRVVVKHGYP